MNSHLRLNLKEIHGKYLAFGHSADWLLAECHHAEYLIVTIKSWHENILMKELV